MYRSSAWDISESAIAESNARLPIGLARFLGFEQRNLWKPYRVRRSAPDAGFDSRYLPENCRVFRLPCYWVRRKHLYVYGRLRGADAEFGTIEGDGPDARVLLPVHPSEIPNYAEFLERVRAVDVSLEGTAFEATASSSTRTLLMWPEGAPGSAVFAKLSLHSGFLGDRRLQPKQVAGSVGLSRLVLETGDNLPRGLRYFPEFVGLSPRLMLDGGVIVRSIPSEIRNGRITVAPLFALMGGSEGHPPLLLEFLRMGSTNVYEFIDEVLLARFAGIWVDLVFKCGLILEAHGQDLLFALSPDLVPLSDFYYRDFEGLAVDWALRRARGLREPAVLPGAFDWFRTYETWGYPFHQLVFWKLRTSLFDYLYFVLTQLDETVTEWRANGVISGQRIWPEELTVCFSRYLRMAIREKTGMWEAETYDVHHQLNRFIKFLMQVRREVMYGNTKLANI